MSAERERAAHAIKSVSALLSVRGCAEINSKRDREREARGRVRALVQILLIALPTSSIYAHVHARLPANKTMSEA